MHTVHAYVNTTNHYADGWRYLDSDNFVATVRLTAPHMLKHGADRDEGDTYTQYVRVPRGVNAGMLGQALRHTLGGSNCKHEYDCCGCATHRVSVKLTAPRRLLVRTQISYNY